MTSVAAHYDAVIVGARCAGAATALLLARAGAKVLLIDRQTRGSDTMSTHALMRSGVQQLQKWGLISRIAGEGTPTIATTTFHYGRDVVSIPIKSEFGVEHLYAPRRMVLDGILVDAAEAAGTEVRHGVSLTALQFNSSERVCGVWIRHDESRDTNITADIVIGADGRQSTVAKFVAARTYLESRHASALVYGYFDGLPDNGLHWYFGDRVAAGVIPTNGGQHCVFSGVAREQFASVYRGDVQRGYARTLERCCPDLAAAIDMRKLIGSLRGFPGARGFLRQACGPGWALVGDAGYFKDPLTAHGITDALRDAELLSRAVLAGDDRSLSAYQNERDRLSIPLFEVTDAIASFGWTLEHVKRLHGQLSRAIKAEAVAMAQIPPPFRKAA